MKDITLTQIKKLINEEEFSKEAKKEIDEILNRAEVKGKLESEDKEALLEAIKADMVLDAIEIKGHQGVLEQIDKLIADLKSS